MKPYSNLKVFRVYVGGMKCYPGTVDGWNPRQPPGMVKTLYILGSSSSLVVQDFVHQQYVGIIGIIS